MFFRQISNENDGVSSQEVGQTYPSQFSNKIRRTRLNSNQAILHSTHWNACITRMMLDYHSNLIECMYVLSSVFSVCDWEENRAKPNSIYYVRDDAWQLRVLR